MRGRGRVRGRQREALGEARGCGRDCWMLPLLLGRADHVLNHDHVIWCALRYMLPLLLGRARADHAC